MVRLPFAIPFAIPFAKTISANKTQTTLYNYDLIILLYSILLGLLSSVCRISCSSSLVMLCQLIRGFTLQSIDFLLALYFQFQLFFRWHIEHVLCLEEMVVTVQR